MAMIAIEATIVSTAMPQIAAQLGQINLYSWVFDFAHSTLRVNSSCSPLFASPMSLSGSTDPARSSHDRVFLY